MPDFLFPDGLLGGDPPYWYAAIGHGTGRVVRNYEGPASAPEGTATAIVVLEPGGTDVDAFLSRYDSRGRFVSDAWYPTREAALQDLAGEFAISLGTWHPVPPAVTDVEPFVFDNATF
jgi:hypothetical protein